MTDRARSETIVVIPARMASTRLPGKPLADICGEPMIVQVLNRAREAGFPKVLVAAAEAEIAAAVAAAGGEAVLTDPALPSGSDRVAAALALADPERRFRYVVNLQGDLPTMDPHGISACLMALLDTGADIATLAALITDEAEVTSPNVVKAIAPLAQGRPVVMAEDFRREVKPDTGPYFHHIGIYAYQRLSLERFVSLTPSARETERKLEQMRALDNGMSIAVARVDTVPFGVDTPEDLERARRSIAARNAGETRH